MSALCPGRRSLLVGALAWCAVGRTQAVDYATVRPGVPLVFPRDFGSHPAFRTEWWYVTGWLRAADGRDVGMQLTFFRSRTGIGEDSRSAFAPSQLLFAHAAIADASVGHLLHDQRVARAGLGLAEAAQDSTRVHIGDWSLQREGDGYVARVVAREFAFNLRLRTTARPLLQGEGGYSRKDSDVAHASYYYSEPQLAVSGTLTRSGRAAAVTGMAWLDHEWSTTVLAAGAVGWDWTGINLDDGGALTVFRMRGRDGATLFAGGSLRAPDGTISVLAPDDVRIEPLRTWRSPRTSYEYPVAVRVAARGQAWDLEPLMDDQELDTRASTGTVYWEGAVTAHSGGRVVGRGYLELTGYGQPLTL